VIWPDGAAWMTAPEGTLRNILAIIGMEADEMRELLRG
jgi:hypothetical protein